MVYGVFLFAFSFCFQSEKMLLWDLDSTNPKALSGGIQKSVGEAHKEE